MNILIKNYLNNKLFLKKNPIYLDYFSTTPIDPRVIKKMIFFLNNNFGNSSSRSHIYGWDVEKNIENARKEVAKLLKVSSQEIIWTSGATESNNLAIKGVAGFYKFKGNHLITVKTEHKSVLDTFRNLERCGFIVTYIKPKKNGLIDIQDIISNIKNNTILISVMLVNNEIGVIQPIEEIGKICREKGIIFHCDAAQAIGKINLNVSKMNVDLMSLSAHKVYGPKGIGALYISKNPRIRLEAQIHGGGQERGLRSGTLATHQIVGMGEAFRITRLEMEKELIRIKYMFNKLKSNLECIEESYINGDLKFRVPHNLNISFNYIEGESLIMSVKEIAISSGSACTSSSLEPSYVLKSLGISDELAHSSIRLTIGRFTTEEEIDFAIFLIKKNVKKLRKISPLWEMYKEGINLNTIKWKI